LHVDNVVTISLGATSSSTGRARITGAQSEANKALLEKAHILLTIGLLVPLNKVVASLELEGVIGDPLHHLLVFLFTIFQTTSLGKELLSNLGVGLQGITNIDGRGASSSKNGKENGCSELHGWLLVDLGDFERRSNN
jgi:hypothetical protein